MNEIEPRKGKPGVHKDINVSRPDDKNKSTSGPKIESRPQNEKKKVDTTIHRGGENGKDKDIIYQPHKEEDRSLPIDVSRSGEVGSHKNVSVVRSGDEGTKTDIPYSKHKETEKPDPTKSKRKIIRAGKVGKHSDLNITRSGTSGSSSDIRIDRIGTPGNLSDIEITRGGEYGSQSDIDITRSGNIGSPSDIKITRGGNAGRVSDITYNRAGTLGKQSDIDVKRGGKDGIQKDISINRDGQDGKEKDISRPGVPDDQNPRGRNEHNPAIRKLLRIMIGLDNVPYFNGNIHDISEAADRVLSDIPGMDKVKISQYTSANYWLHKLTNLILPQSMNGLEDIMGMDPENQDIISYFKRNGDGINLSRIAMDLALRASLLLKHKIKSKIRDKYAGSNVSSDDRVDSDNADDTIIYNNYVGALKATGLRGPDLNDSRDKIIKEIVDKRTMHISMEGTKNGRTFYTKSPKVDSDGNILSSRDESKDSSESVTDDNFTGLREEFPSVVKNEEDIWNKIKSRGENHLDEINPNAPAADKGNHSDAQRTYANSSTKIKMSNGNAKLSKAGSDVTYFGYRTDKKNFSQRTTKKNGIYAESRYFPIEADIKKSGFISADKYVNTDEDSKLLNKTDAFFFGGLKEHWSMTNSLGVTIPFEMAHSMFWGIRILRFDGCGPCLLPDFPFEYNKYNGYEKGGGWWPVIECNFSKRQLKSKTFSLPYFDLKLPKSADRPTALSLKLLDNARHAIRYWLEDYASLAFDLSNNVTIPYKNLCLDVTIYQYDITLHTLFRGRYICLISDGDFRFTGSPTDSEDEIDLNLEIVGEYDRSLELRPRSANTVSSTPINYNDET